MAEVKKYRAFTGLKEFYYGELKETEDGIKGTAVERIKFLQNISTETSQEIVRSYGDNEVAELAVSNGPTTLTTQFHTIPTEDRARLYGMKKINGLLAHTTENRPPYVACAFARTAEDGGTEWLGFAKGMFTMPNTEGQTKEDGVEFGNAETTGEFMQRELNGANEKAVYLVGYDAPGETTNRDALFQAIFGVAHPDAPVVPGV